MGYTFRKFEERDRIQICETLVPKARLDDCTSRTLKSTLLALFALCRDHLYVLVDTRTGAIVGTVLLRQRVDRYFLGMDWWIREVGIASSYQGRGLGKQLLENALIELKAYGAERVFLYVDPKNLIAHHLYEQEGFQLVAQIHPGVKPFLVSAPSTCFPTTRSISKQEINDTKRLDLIMADLFEHSTSTLIDIYRRLLSCCQLLRTTLCQYTTTTGTLIAITVTYGFFRMKLELIPTQLHDSDSLRHIVFSVLTSLSLCKLRKIDVTVRTNYLISENFSFSLAPLNVHSTQDLMMRRLA